MIPSFSWIGSARHGDIKEQKLIMADHLIGKSWGLSGALATALLTLALIAPAGAEAAGPLPGAPGQLGAVVPPTESAVSTALSQAPPASGAAATGAAVPERAASVPVVTPPAPPPVPVVARPTPPPAPATPTPVALAPATAGLMRQAVSAPARSVPQPDAVPAVNAAPSLSSAARPDTALEGQSPADRRAHPRAHQPAARMMPARPVALTRRARVSRFPFAHPWSPAPVLDGTSRRGTQPVAPARRADSGRGRHIAPPRSSPEVALTTSPVALPLSAELAPGGAEGSAAGAGGGAAGATAAAVLALVGVCILRALLPGLLGLGLAPVQSALLVSRLERPG